jgi:DNA-binding MarR family transcriptional regulator
VPRTKPQTTAGAVAAPPDLASRLGYLLKHAQLRFQSLQHPALAPLNITGRLLAVLVLIGDEGPALQQRLSARLGVDRTTMVALVDALETGGLVARRRDTADRRGHLVGLTSAGQTVLDRGLRASDDVERSFLAPLSADERVTFRRLLSKLVIGDFGD